MARGDLIFDWEAEDHAQQTDVDDALQNFGLYAERPATATAPVFSLWPENVPAFELWRRLQTQWRIGMQGPDGLDYAGVWAVLVHTVPLRKRKGLFSAITHMEAGARQGFAQLRAEQQTQG